MIPSYRAIHLLRAESGGVRIAQAILDRDLIGDHVRDLQSGSAPVLCQYRFPYQTRHLRCIFRDVAMGDRDLSLRKMGPRISPEHSSMALDDRLFSFLQ